MRKLTPRQVIRALILIWMTIVAIQFINVIITQVKEVTTEYSKIDPLLSDSPDIRVLGGHVTINSEITSESPEIVKRLAIRGSIMRNLSMLIYRLFVLIVLFNILLIFRTWSFSHFFIQNNAKLIRRISFLYLGLVIVYFLIYQSASILFPVKYIEDYYNVLTINYPIPTAIGTLSHIASSILMSIDGNALIVFFLLYVLSLTLKKGIELQEQSDLTI